MALLPQKLADLVHPMLAKLRKEAVVYQPDPRGMNLFQISAHDLARLVIISRQEFGRSKYGFPLFPDNGRDSLLDSIQEQADGLAYACNEYAKRELGLVKCVHCGKNAYGPESE